MVSVSASATRYGISDGPAGAAAGPLHPAAALGGMVALALALALTAPLDVFVFGILLIGVTHVVLELRYVIGRFPRITQGHLAMIVHGTLALVALGRLVPALGLGVRGEIVGWGLLVAVAVVVTTADAPRIRATGLAITGGATAIAWAGPDTWIVVQSHLHNLVPAAFMWDWANRALVGPARRAVRAVTIAWVAVVPALLLTGMLASLRTGTAWAAGAVAEVSALDAVTPPGWRGGDLPGRLLVAFAFAQLVHYGVWCVFLPRYAPDVTRSFAATPPGRWFRGGRLALLALGLTAVVGLLAAVDYGQGKTLYTTFGAYHAYLEYPVLAALLAVWATRRRDGAGDGSRPTGGADVVR